MDVVSFEEAFTQLEAAVRALQDGQMPLEQALEQYEEGVKLARHCNQLLQQAELRVQQLGIDEDGTPSVQPLNL